VPAKQFLIDTIDSQRAIHGPRFDSDNWTRETGSCYKQRGGPPSHKEWTASPHSGLDSLPPETF